MSEIEKCPFCANSAEVRQYYFGDSREPSYTIECMNQDCGVEIGWYDTITESLKVWNRREQLEQLKRENENLESQLNAKAIYYDSQHVMLENAKKELTQLKRENEELREIVDNVQYWDTCPDSMKDDIKKLLQPPKKG